MVSSVQLVLRGHPLRQRLLVLLLSFQRGDIGINVLRKSSARDIDSVLLHVFVINIVVGDRIAIFTVDARTEKR